jgi:predicted O-methyltransferase YrrM
MARFNVTVVTIEGSTIHHAFDEVHDSLCWALSALGHQVSKTENWFSESKETNIILGPEIMADFQQVPRNSILVNLEQRSHPHLAKVKRLAKGLTVWDFSKSTLADWPDAKVVHHLEIGYTPNLTRIPRHNNKDIDLFFAGFMTQRRREFLDSLRSLNLKMFIAGAACYGGVRDEILSRTKLALNIHHDNRDQFEIVRCSYLMANSVPVMSEFSSDDEDYLDLTGILRSDLRAMPELIQSLLSNSFKRDLIAQDGFGEIQKRDFTATVAAALDGTSSNHPIIPPDHHMSRPLEFSLERRAVKKNFLEQGRKLADSYAESVAKAKVYQRYENALVEGDMKDFAAWLRAHATGNIVEIGVRYGASTSAFLAGVSETYGHVWSIDIDPKCADLFKDHPNWTFLHANSQNFSEVCALIPYHIDLLLIDGDHSYEGVKSDFTYHQNVREGGYVVLHDIAPEAKPDGCTDCSWPGDGVKRFWEELKEDSTNGGWEFFEIPGRYGMGVLQRWEKARKAQ